MSAGNPGQLHSHGRDCCWECFSGPDSHPETPGDDDACKYEGCPPELAGTCATVNKEEAE